MNISKKTSAKILIMYICCFAAYFFVYFHRVSPAVTAANIQSAFGVGSAGLGLLSSVYFYAYAAMQLPAGLLADHLGPRKTITIALLVASAGSILFGMSGSFEGAVLGRMLVGLGVACIFVPTVKLFSVWSPPNRLATLMGILMLVGNVGAISASYPLTKAVLAVGWRVLFVAVGLFTLLLALANYLSIKDTPVNHQKNSPGVPKEEKVSLSFLRSLLNAEFGLLAIWFFCFNGTIFALQGLWGGPLLATCYQMDPTTVGYVLMYFGIGFGLGAPIMGKLFDASGDKKTKTLFIGSMAYTLFWLLFTVYMEALTVTYLVFTFFTLGFLGSSVVGVLSKVKEMYPVKYAGTAVGAINTMAFAGAAFWQQSLGLAVSEPLNIMSFKYILLLCLGGLVVANIALLGNIKFFGNAENQQHVKP